MLPQRIRTVSLLLTIAVMIAAALFTAGCQDRSGVPETPDTAHQKRTTITMMMPMHQTQAPHDSMVQALEQATGSKLYIDWIPNEIYRDKVVNSLETNTLSKVTYVSQQDYAVVKSGIRSGMFWEIGPYLEQYPNLRKLDKGIFEEIAVEEKIYGLFAEREPSRQGILIRKDWLDRLGIALPQTPEDLYQVLKGFTYDDPDGNGKDDTIGLTDRNDLMFGAFKTLSSYFGTPNNWGVADGKLVPEFMTAEYASTMDYMRRLYQEKLINRDFTITSKQVQRYMLISGKAGVYVGNLADAPRIREELHKLNPEAELALVNRIQGPKGYGTWSMPGFSGVFMFSKKAIVTEQELKDILAYYDRTMDADVCNLMQYGLEGEHYTLKDGQVVYLPDKEQERNRDILPLWTMMIANLSNPNLLQLKLDEQEPFTLLAERLIKDNSGFLIHDPTRNLSSATYDAKWADLQQMITDATYRYITGVTQMEGFYREIREWENKGGTAIIQELNNAYIIDRESRK
ncbi:MAG: extracellular solute-binding protein family 1 [Paenibacillaceae bacterium]|jgi:putative aldouronate transport system substrate-binding protein|nr:extracellular solute-binding protein family 1 [Paenibacillaceae bacterium]